MNLGTSGSVRVSSHWSSDEGALKSLVLFVPIWHIVLATAKGDTSLLYLTTLLAISSAEIISQQIYSPEVSKI